jgi:hypothetical protein
MQAGDPFHTYGWLMRGKNMFILMELVFWQGWG